MILRSFPRIYEISVNIFLGLWNACSTACNFKNITYNKEVMLFMVAENFPISLFTYNLFLWPGCVLAIAHWFLMTYEIVLRKHSELWLEEMLWNIGFLERDVDIQSLSKCGKGLWERCASYCVANFNYKWCCLKVSSRILVRRNVEYSLDERVKDIKHGLNHDKSIS